MHGNVWAQILDAHCHLTEPINKGSQGLSLLLADAHQGDGCQVVRSAGGELGLKLRHECGKAANGLGESLMNQLMVAPFKYVGNTRHNTASSEV